MNKLSADSIYAKKITQVDDFRFDDSVASVFTDMVNRSVPSYADMVKYIGLLANRYVQNEGLVYDLGCSLGAVSLAVDQSAKEKKFNLVAVDYSEAMLEQMREVTKSYFWNHPVKIEQADVRDYELDANSVTVMNFVLQFLPPEDRQTMVQSIYDALLPGGVFILSEKIKLDDPAGDELIFDLHHDFKRSQGYSELEIAQKRDAIEEVMKIDSVSVQIERLKSVGFTQAVQWFQAYNFVSFLAIK